MRVLQGNFPRSEIGTTPLRPVRPKPHIQHESSRPPRSGGLPGLNGSKATHGLSLLQIRQPRMQNQLGGDEYHPGFRNTVGWSQRAGRAKSKQPHLQMVSAGTALMDGLAPGLRRKLARRLAVNLPGRQALRIIDDKIVKEAQRVASTPQQSAIKNNRLLEMVAERHDIWLQVDELAIAARRQIAPDMGRLMRRLHTRHGPAAGRRADRIQIADSVKDRMPAQLRSWARAFYRLTGPNAPIPERLTFTRSTDRAFFDAGPGHVNLGKHIDADTVFHELGHAMETDVFDVMQAAESWRDARSENAHGTLEPVALAELCPGARYPVEEQALQDHFVSPYVGRVYEVFGTEVLSMGLEHFVSTARMTQLYEQDPEHFLLVLGALEEVQP